MLISTALCSINDVGEARHMLFGILIKLCVDGLVVTTSHAQRRSRELYIFIGKSSLQDNYIKTIVQLKAYVFLILTA